MKTTFKIIAVTLLLGSTLAQAQDSDWETYDSSSESQEQTPSYPDDSNTSDTSGSESQDTGSTSEDYDL